MTHFSTYTDVPEKLYCQSASQPTNQPTEQVTGPANENTIGVFVFTGDPMYHYILTNKNYSKEPYQ